MITTRVGDSDIFLVLLDNDDAPIPVPARFIEPLPPQPGSRPLERGEVPIPDDQEYLNQP